MSNPKLDPKQVEDFVRKFLALHLIRLFEEAGMIGVQCVYDSATAIEVDLDDRRFTTVFQLGGQSVNLVGHFYLFDHSAKVAPFIMVLKLTLRLESGPSIQWSSSLGLAIPGT